jgi:hypothetical protein
MSVFTLFIAMATTLITIIGPALAQEDKVLVNEYYWIVQQPKVNIAENTLKQLNTPEGKAIIGTAATLIGLDPTLTGTIIGIAGAASKLTSSQNGDERSGLIQSPVGYTICAARPSNPHYGAGDKGIETHCDTTFNSTILRVHPGVNLDGLGWYMAVPRKVGCDSRVAAPFVVVWVKADPGWQNQHHCEPTGEHPWLARNNSTRLNVACNPSERPLCPQ